MLQDAVLQNTSGLQEAPLTTQIRPDPDAQSVILQKNKALKYTPQWAIQRLEIVREFDDASGKLHSEFQIVNNNL